MHPTVKAARIAGPMYLSTLPYAVYFWSYLSGTLIVRGNATATAGNVLTHETLFRFWIFGGDLFAHVILICLAFLLYRLFRDVNRIWAFLMVAFALVSAAVGFLNALNSIAALILFRGGEFLTVLDKPQREALAMFQYIDRFASCVMRFLTTTPLNLSREEWIYLFFAMVLCGFVCMRGLGHKGY